MHLWKRDVSKETHEHRPEKNLQFSNIKQVLINQKIAQITYLMHRA